MASSDTGMALKEMSAPRQSRSVSSSSSHHQQRANGQRVAQLPDGTLDEARRAQQRRVILHAALRQRRHQHLQALLELARDLERVGAVLGGGLHQDAGLCAG